MAAPPPGGSLPTTQGPSKVLHEYIERQDVYDHQLWTEAGGGTRFSHNVPLRVLPPGEPITVEMLIHNTAPVDTATTYYIALTNANLQGTRLCGETGDIPPGLVMDAMHTLAANLSPGDYSLTVFCQPHAAVGRPQDPMIPPTLAPMDGPLAPGLPGLHGVIKVRSEVNCPQCGGNLLWTPAGMGGRPRAWVCGRCGLRLESGTI